MATKIFTPTNQIKLTNIAVVRLKKNGKRFEVACYKNKAVSWRNGTEKDISEVLQSPRVFTNVSKGQFAKKDDILSAFGTEDENVVSKIILEKGELQVSEKERDAATEALFHETANAIANMCINPETHRPHPVTFIERSLKDVHFSVKPNKSAKQQALELIPKLKEHIPIERAKMRIRVLIDRKLRKTVESALRKSITFASHTHMFVNDETEEDGGGDEQRTELICLIDPGEFRKLEETVMRVTSGAGVVEVLSCKEVEDVDGDVAGASGL